MLVEELQSKNKILEENGTLLKEKVATLEKKLKKHEGKKGTQNVSQGKPPNYKVNDTQVSNLPENSGEIVEIQIHKNPSHIDPSSSNEPQMSKTNEVKDSDNKLQNGGDQNKWQEVSYKKKNNRPVKGNRPEPLKGSSDDNVTLKTAPQMAFLFVSGLAPEVNSDGILQYLETKKLKGCTCKKIKTKKEKYRSSFKLAVPRQDRDKYLVADLWPCGVVINHFLNLQRRKVVINQKTISQVRKEKQAKD